MIATSPTTQRRAAPVGALDLASAYRTQVKVLRLELAEARRTGHVYTAQVVQGELDALICVWRVARLSARGLR